MGDATIAKHQRFELAGRLGSGGMGVVYRAFDREISRYVALKVLPHRGGDAVLRFKTEFQALQDIRHPNLCSLGELFVQDGQWFFTMELVEGVDFLEAVRGPRQRDGALSLSAQAPTTSNPSFDETVDAASLSEDSPVRPTTITGALRVDRLREALLQVTRALVALHAAQKVHRDIKPSNILVTDTGRAVVLDFGLAADLRGPVRDEQILGTVDYMAPEQVRGETPVPASDWYSLGVMLYEALTGKVPFSGPALRILSEKQSKDPPTPTSIAPDVPEDLARLAMDLMRRDPADRPAGAEIVRRLGGALHGAEDLPAGRALTSMIFMGREAEMATLERAARDAVAQGALTVLVRGPSGIGKSALVRRFADRFLANSSRAAVLSGRCYERASVPYKALDGVMDALSHHLRALPAEDVIPLLAADAPMLPQVFPVLGRVPALGLEPAPSQRILDKHELRARVFAAVRETLGGLARRGPLLVTIDDLQWTDQDSIALITEILRPPDAPPLLLIATMRAAHETGPVSTASDLPGEVRVLDIEPLPIAVASALAEKLLAASPHDGAIDAAALAREAGGHPMFIDELARHVRARHGALPADLRLDDALRARIRDLDDAGRAALDVIALAGAPIRQSAAATAANLDTGDFVEAIATLRAANLVRTSGAHGADLAEPYHDRVREAVTAAMDAAKRARIHGALATALEASGADPEALVLHYQGADMKKNAARCALQAAERAVRSLAFDRAARLYALTLEEDPDREDARAIRIAEADARANAGRGGEAADVYLRAAEGAPEDQALDLTRRAAEQLMRTGHVERGIQTLDRVLRALGLGLPGSRGRLIASLLWNRAKLSFRGVEFVQRAEHEIAPAVLARIDATWSGAVGFAMVDPIQAAALETQNLLLALDAGEPFRVARALALETTFIDTEGPKNPEKRDRLIARAEPLARSVANPYAFAYVLSAHAERLYNTGRYPESIPRIEEAMVAFRDRCTGAQWETASMHMYLVAALFYSGRFGDLVRIVPRLVQEALGRSDVFSAAVFRTGFSNLVHLVADRPEIAEREANEAARGWSGRGFQVQHYYHLLAMAQAEIYAGEPERAAARIDAAWKSLDASLLLRVQTVRMEATFLHGRALVATARKTTNESARKTLLKRAKSIASRLEGEHNHQATPHFAALLRAAIAAIGGDPDRARALLRDAAEAFDAIGMKLFAAAARSALASITSDAEAPALLKQAELAFREHGVASAPRMASLLAPGFT